MCVYFVVFPYMISFFSCHVPAGKCEFRYEFTFSSSMVPKNYNRVIHVRPNEIYIEQKPKQLTIFRIWICSNNSNNRRSCIFWWWYEQKKANIYIFFAIVFCLNMRPSIPDDGYAVCKGALTTMVLYWFRSAFEWIWMVEMHILSLAHIHPFFGHFNNS